MNKKNINLFVGPIIFAAHFAAHFAARLRLNICGP